MPDRSMISARLMFYTLSRYMARSVLYVSVHAVATISVTFSLVVGLILSTIHMTLQRVRLYVTRSSDKTTPNGRCVVTTIVLAGGPKIKGELCFFFLHAQTHITPYLDHIATTY